MDSENDTGPNPDPDTDSDTGVDTDSPPVEICKNDYHPIHLQGWSKTFSVAYTVDETLGTGTATEAPLPSEMENGETIYKIKDTLEVDMELDPLGLGIVSIVTKGLGLHPVIEM